MLEHAGEALALAEWRQVRPTLSGKAVIAGEIVAAIALGMLLPLWLSVVAVRRAGS
jgi:hypothetical protein